MTDKLFSGLVWGIIGILVALILTWGIVTPWLVSQDSDFLVALGFALAIVPIGLAASVCYHYHYHKANRK